MILTYKERPFHKANCIIKIGLKTQINSTFMINEKLIFTRPLNVFKDDDKIDTKQELEFYNL